MAVLLVLREFTQVHILVNLVQTPLDPIQKLSGSGKLAGKIRWVPENPNRARTGISRENMAIIYETQGLYDQALEIYNSVLETKVQVVGDHRT